MELSQYVVESICAVNNLNLNHRFQVVSQLRDDASKAKNKEDSHILYMVSGALSMSFVFDEKKFQPMLIFDDGSRSFAIEDIGQSDIAILKTVADVSEGIWIRAQLFHIIWHLTHDYRYGKQAVEAYLKLFDETFDPSEWSDCNKAVQCAVVIASTLGKTSDVLKTTRSVINRKLVEMDGNDPLFLSLNLLQLVIQDASKEDLAKYMQIVTKLANKNISNTNPNTHLADETYSVQKLVLSRLKKVEEKKAAKNRFAAYYEDQAEIYAKRKDYLRAVNFLKKACTLYGKTDLEKNLRLRTRLEELQEKSLKSMQPISIKIDTKPTYDLVARLFSGLTLQEKIVQLGRIACFYNVDEVKQKLLKSRDENFLFSTFRSCMLNENGQIVQELPPLNKIDAGSNPDLLHKHMVRYVSEQRKLKDSLVLKFAFRYLPDSGTFVEEDLDFLVSDNAIIPENRKEIVREGLFLGLSGKLYAAMHILLPQMEHIFRNLVRICGDTVTFLKEDGTEEYKPLSALFKSERLRECYSEDIIFNFQSIMDEPIGENLRNLNAHGLLDPQTGGSSEALCFLCLFIKLLMMYGINARKIANELAERDPS